MPLVPTRQRSGRVVHPDLHHCRPDGGAIEPFPEFRNGTPKSADLQANLVLRAVTQIKNSPLVPTSGESGLEAQSHREENANVTFISIPRVHGAKINATVSWRGEQPGGGEVRGCSCFFWRLRANSQRKLAIGSQDQFQRPSSKNRHQANGSLTHGSSPSLSFFKRGFSYFPGTVLRFRKIRETFSALAVVALAESARCLCASSPDSSEVGTGGAS